MARIGLKDVEFYYSALVLNVARSLAPDYDHLTYRPRQRVLDKAVEIVTTMLNDDTCLRQMSQFVNQHVGAVLVQDHQDPSAPMDQQGRGQQSEIMFVCHGHDKRS